MFEELRNFLSTETRKKVFLSYMLGPKAQSDVAALLQNKVSVSSVERITSILTYLKALEKGEVKDNKQIYCIDWNLWIRETFVVLGLKGIEDKTIEDIASILSMPELISFNFYISHPKVTKAFIEITQYGEKLKKNMSIPPDLLLQYIIKKGTNPADYPSIFILLGSPFRDLIPDEKDSDKKANVILSLFNEIYEDSKNIGIVKLEKEQLEKVLQGLNAINEKVNKIFVSVLTKEVEKEVNRKDEEDE